MLLRKKAVESLVLRNQNRIRREVRIRNTKRIDKIKYFGIKKNISEYESLLFKTLYDPKLIEELIDSDTSITEDLGGLFSEYLQILSERMNKELSSIVNLFNDTFTKGSRRVLNKKGEPVKPEIKFSKVVDNQALDVIKSTQQTYIKNITRKQEEVILDLIGQGITAGKGSKDVAKQISLKLKGITQARAQTIARTEMVKAHNIGQVETMKEVGATTYIYWTAGDKKVSEICKKNQGSRSNPNIYQLQGAGNINNPMPVLQSHPNCRCTILIND